MLESLFFNKIVVSNKFKYVSEIIKNNDNGFLYDYNDSASAVNVLSYVLDSYDDLDYIRENSKSFISNHIDIDDFVKSYENIYKNMWGKNDNK